MKVKLITSENNSTYRLFLELTKARGIKKHGMAILSGPKQVREVLRDFPERCAGVILADYHETPPLPENIDITLYRISKELYKKIDLFGTKNPVLLLKFNPFPQWDENVRTPGCTLIAPFQDPANIGAVIRSSAAFGASMVVLAKETAHPFNPKSLRAAGSTIFRIPIEEGPSIYKMRITQTPVITLSPKGKNVMEFEFPPSFCLVPGMEGPGLPEQLHNKTALSIPMAKGVESLNSAVAASIVLYLWRNRSGGLTKN
ncbi:MAG TPA: RNA methyltransferase [Desulfobacteraceae bacterium]|nr:RNA methyltransferase [Desulfobacteraceae bacterium]HPJ66553.1 RNA methyltransferase [Desulfobacteraceae bacterium]